MAAPNLKSDTLVILPAPPAVYNLTSTSYVEIISDVAVGYAYFLEQISVTNNGSVSANVTLQLRDSGSPALSYNIAFKRTLQVKSSFNAAQGRAHILTEGWSLWGKLEAAGSVDVVVPYTLAHE